jgi:hypothetical protein
MSIKPGKLARILRVSRKTIHKWAKDGKIPCTRKTKGGHHYFEDRPQLWKAVNAYKATKRWRDAPRLPSPKMPPDLRLLRLFSRAANFATSHQVERVSATVLEEMRRELEPVAAMLWPEKFPGSEKQSD